MFTPLSEMIDQINKDMDAFFAENTEFDNNPILQEAFLDALLEKLDEEEELNDFQKSQWRIAIATARTGVLLEKIKYIVRST
jgi:hypothetical protein